MHVKAVRDTLVQTRVRVRVREAKVISVRHE